MLTKQEIRQLGNREMMEELQRSRRELLKSQFDVRNGTSKEAHVVQNLKKYIAQLQTIAQEMNANAKPAMDKTDALAAAAKGAAEVNKAPATAKKEATPKKTGTKAAKVTDPRMGAPATKGKSKSAKK